MPQQTRHYIHGVITAAIPLLVIAGVIAGDQAQLWLTLAAAILALPSTGQAFRYSDPSKVDVVNKR